MSKTLSLLDHLFLMAERSQDLNRPQDALRFLKRLAGLRDLPADLAEEVHARIAEIQLGRRKYLLARRHLSVALHYRPDCARYHYLMATAIIDDETADPNRALEHYRRSLELDPEQPDCLGEFALLALSMGHAEEGLSALRKAAELEPDDPEMLATVAEGLCEADQAQEAQRLLQAARFRHPRDARFTKLWNDFRFQQLREEQEAARQSEPASPADDCPVVLPFVRPATETSGGGKKIRRDSAAPLPAPRSPRTIRWSDRRHA
jgi:tetratricopeptide (TPR) repeat protein